MKEQKLRKRIRTIIQEDLHAQKTAGEHVRARTREAEKFARMIRERIDPEDNDLPEWLVEKVSLAANDLNDVFQFLDTNWEQP